MSLVYDAADGIGGIVHEISRAEEGGFHLIFLQHVENPVSSRHRDFHTLLQREIHSMFAWNVKLFGVKTKKNHCYLYLVCFSATNNCPSWWNTVQK